MHGLDLPFLKQRPALEELRNALNTLSINLPDWQDEQAVESDSSATIPWLVRVIASQLQWLDSATQVEEIHSLAARRLAERSGRVAFPSSTRKFRISPADIELRIHEPSLASNEDGDLNLGAKTWGTAYTLACKLALMKSLIPANANVLELGSGTGLAGLAAGAIWGVPVTLTDLSSILPNLKFNVEANPQVSRVKAQVLDWRQCTYEADVYNVVLVSDPLYDAAHPKLVTDVVSKVLSHTSDARLITACPLRPTYAKEIADLESRLRILGLVNTWQVVEESMDDWGSFQCRITVWRFVE